MRFRLAMLMLAATALPAYSQDGDPFAGKSAEEVATYLVFGLKDKAKLLPPDSENSSDAATVEIVATQPFTIRGELSIGGNRAEYMRVVTIATDRCTFVFDVNPNGDPGLEKYKLSVNLANVSAVHQQSETRAKLAGATMTCVEPADLEWCQNMKDVAMNKLERRAMHQDMSVTGSNSEAIRRRLEPEQRQSDAALAYFRKDICPQ